MYGVLRGCCLPAGPRTVGRGDGVSLGPILGQPHHRLCFMFILLPLGWHLFGQDAFVKIVRHEGTRTLWSGLPATL